MQELFGTQGRLISDETYKKLTQRNNLNSLWRSLFSPIETVEQVEYLLEEMKKVRQGFLDMQPEMIEGVSKNVLKNIPLRFIRDTNSSSGVEYLRWRNVSNDRGGRTALRQILDDPNQPDIIKDALMKVERERIIFNMQVRMVSSIIRLLSECRDGFIQYS